MAEMIDTTIKVKIDQKAISKLTTDRGGSVDVFTRTLAVQVAASARERVGVKSGKTKESIRVTPSRPPSWNVVASSPAAVVHHEGTKPHPIGPKKAGGRLVFFWKNAGRQFIGRPGQSIRHPGTAPNPYLVRAAQALGLRVKSKSSR